MLKFIDRFFLKYNTRMARERTKYEEEQYWGAAARCVAPATLSEHKNGKYLVLNNNIYKRTVILGIPPTDRINGYPKGLNESMINRLLGMSVHGSQLSISSKFIPIPGDESTKMMNKANFKNEIKQYDSKKSHEKNSDKVVNLVDESLKIERKHNVDNFHAIMEDNQKQFHSSLILTLKSSSIEGLDILESDISSIMGQEGVSFEVPTYHHKETLLAAQPYNITPDYTTVQVLAPYAAVLTPSVDPNTKTDKQGLFFGYDKITNKSIVIDIFALAAMHAVVFGPTQSGKTFTMLMLLWRIVSELQCRVVYLTPKADKNTDHKALVKHLGDIAELIETGPGGRNINPMQILYDRSQLKEDPEKYIHAYNTHKGILKLSFEDWFKDTGTINMSNFIDYSMNKCYENFGIYRNIPSTWHDAKWPILTDLFAIWEEEKKNTKDADDLKTIRAVLRKVYSLGEGGTLEYLNHQTDKNIDLSKDFIVIDMSGTPPEIEGFMRILISGMMAQRFSTDANKKTFLTIDESRVFLQNPRMSNFLMTTLTQGASQNVALWLLTQQATDLKKSNVAEEFQTNAFIKIVFGNNMDEVNVKYISEFFGLNVSDEKQIINSAVGEGMLIIGKRKIPMIFKPTELEYDVIKGAYLKDGNKSVANKLGELDERLIPLVMEQGFCINGWAPDSTMIQGWVREPVANVFGAGTITAWVRKKAIPSNQSLDHFSTVVQIAEKLIISGAKDVVINHFKYVDISFSINGISWAIEYERDGSHSEKELKEKRKAAQDKYDRVMFVCSSTYHKKLSDILGNDFVVKRGQSLQDFIESIQ